MSFIKHPLYIEDMSNVINAPIKWDELKNSKVLITGANGLIASFLVDCLMYRNKVHNDNIAIHALCRNEKRARERFASYIDSEHFVLLVQDVSQKLEDAISFDYIIHAASSAHPIAYATTPVEVMKANLIGCINLLDHAREHGTKKFMFVSSGEIYGQNDSSMDKHLEEDYSGYLDTTAMRSAYAQSKRASETLCTAYESQYGINTVIVRPNYIYGSTMIEDSSRADAQFIKKVINGEDIVMKSAGGQLRSYCYVADAVSAMLYILLSEEGKGAYNIANGDCVITIREFAQTLASICGVQVVFENPSDVEKSGYSSIDNAVLSAKKLEGLGWKPTNGMEVGLSKTIKILTNKDV